MAEEGERALNAIYWRDEILQILYWLRGEGIEKRVAPSELVGLLGIDEGTILDQIERLVADGYLICSGEKPARYELSQSGVAEGGRRFADEFAALTGQAHGECSDPNCDCRTLGPEACHTHSQGEA